MAFSMMMIFSFFINSQINILTGLSAFFLENNEGLMRMKRVAIDLFSGLVIPLSFFPAMGRASLGFLPFQAITYLPGLYSQVTLVVMRLSKPLAFKYSGLSHYCCPLVLYGVRRASGCLCRGAKLSCSICHYFMNTSKTT